MPTQAALETVVTPVDSLSITSTTSLNSLIHPTVTPPHTASIATKPVVNYSEDIEKRLKKAFRQGFLDLDEKIRHLPEFERGKHTAGGYKGLYF